MWLEMHQLERRYAGLRIPAAGKRASLLASLAEQGQHAPVLVVASAADEAGYVLIDGYARVEALTALGRDGVEAALLDMGEADALILTHRLATSRRRSALEEGWLIAELAERHDMALRTVAERLSRSVSWVSRRLALVRTLPEPAQAAVKAGRIPAQAATKSLVPLARANSRACEQLVRALGDETVSVREAERLYTGWRQAGDEPTRERIVNEPHLYLKAQAASQQQAPAGDDPAAPVLSDLHAIAGVCQRAHRRINEGLLESVPEPGHSRAERAFRQAELAFATLRDAMETACSTMTNAPPF